MVAHSKSPTVLSCGPLLVTCTLTILPGDTVQMLISIYVLTGLHLLSVTICPLLNQQVTCLEIVLTIVGSKKRSQPYRFVAYSDDYRSTTYDARPENLDTDVTARYGLWVEKLISQARNTIFPPVGPTSVKTGDEPEYSITATTGTYGQVNSPAFFTNIAFRVLWIKTKYVGRTTYHGNAFYGNACDWNTLTRSCRNAGKATKNLPLLTAKVPLVATLKLDSRSESLRVEPPLSYP